MTALADSLRRLSRPTSRQLQDYGVYAAVVLIVLVNVAFTPNFLDAGNIRTQLLQVAPVVIVALGMALVIGTEGIDLSVGSVMALAAAVLPLYLGYGLLPALLMVLVVAAAVGVVNGYLLAVAGLQPIVATLGMLVAGRGLALVIADGQLKQVGNEALLSIGSADVGGVPVIVLVTLVVAGAIGVLVHRTTFGRQLVAVGGNRAASRMAGLPVVRILVTTYVVCAVLSGVAGVLATARLTASDPSAIGQLMELSAITAVVVGGTPLSGGRVRVLGTVAGALLMQLVRATLIKHNLPDSTAQIIQAAIILGAVYVARERSSR
ncbi:MAG: ABC transporter permease [Tetrasphaera sp.]|nr:ABC transporter permease [Tetrasphaera sp.]